MKVRAVVVSVGAYTPLGLSAMPTAFVYRTAMAAMRASPLLDPEGEQATVCFVPTLEPRAVGVERALELAVPAMKEAVEPLAGQALRFKLWLCLDEALGQKSPDQRLPARDLLDRVVRRAGAFVELEDAIATARGPATLGLVLDDIVNELERGAIQAAIVGGVHSDYHPERIRELADAGRLFSTDNLDGLIPGECAAFSVIMQPSVARAQRLPVRAQIHTWGSAMERARPDNDASAFEARGMTAALRKAGEPLGGELRCGWLLTDISFETMRVYELQAASTRTQKLWCDPQYVDAPAQRMGYLGAAALPVHLVLAAEAWRRGWAPHPRAMAYAGSDAGERTAILLSAPS